MPSPEPVACGGVPTGANFTRVWGVDSTTEDDSFGTGVMGCGDVDGDGVEDIAVGHADNNVVYVVYMLPNATVKAVDRVNGASGTSQTGFAVWCGGGFGGAGAATSNITLLANQYVTGDVAVARLPAGQFAAPVTITGSAKFAAIAVAVGGGVGGASRVFATDFNNYKVWWCDWLGTSCGTASSFAFTGAHGLAIVTLPSVGPLLVVGSDAGEVAVYTAPNATSAAAVLVTTLTAQMASDLLPAATPKPTNLANSRFGISLAAVGDVTCDGVPDVVVGADYWDDPSHGGAVWVVAMGANGSVAGTRLLAPTTMPVAGLGRGVGVWRGGGGEMWALASSTPWTAATKSLYAVPLGV